MERCRRLAAERVVGIQIGMFTARSRARRCLRGAVAGGCECRRQRAEIELHGLQVATRGRRSHEDCLAIAQSRHGLLRDGLLGRATRRAFEADEIRQGGFQMHHENGPFLRHLPFRHPTYMGLLRACAVNPQKNNAQRTYALEIH